MAWWPSSLAGPPDRGSFNLCRRILRPCLPACLLACLTVPMFPDDLQPAAAATAAGPWLHISLSTLGRPMMILVTQWQAAGGPDSDQLTWIEGKKMDLTRAEQFLIWTWTSPPLEELPLKGKYSLIHLLRRVGRPAKSVLAVWQAAAVAAQRRSMRADPHPS